MSPSGSGAAGMEQERGPAVQLDGIHTSFWVDVQSGDEQRYQDAFRDALNWHCDAECSQCGAVFCPHHHPLHFHHDDCPACLGLDVAYEAPAPAQEGQHE